VPFVSDSRLLTATKQTPKPVKEARVWWSRARARRRILVRLCAGFRCLPREGCTTIAATLGESWFFHGFTFIGPVHLRAEDSQEFCLTRWARQHPVRSADCTALVVNGSEAVAKMAVRAEPAIEGAVCHPLSSLKDRGFANCVAATGLIEAPPDSNRGCGFAIQPNHYSPLLSTTVTIENAGDFA
jgi:hypothetical protein